MKPNRTDEEAVSPVIGVILMVAITVVLAAIAFVLVTKLTGQQHETAPNLTFTKDAQADTLTVVQVDQGLSWANDVKVSGCTAPMSGDVTAGDTLTACSGTVTVVYVPGNVLVYSTTF